MKLKTRVTSLDDVPEQYKDRYVQAEDGKSWTLDEIELEDVAGLKANHDRILKQHKASQEELKKLKDTLGDLDPVAAREALRKIEEFENQHLMDKGKFEELHTKRTEALNKEHAATVQKLEAKLDKISKELSRSTIENQFSVEAAKKKIRSELLPFLTLAVQKDWTLSEDGKPVWMDKDQVRYSKDGINPATMGDYLTELIATTPSLIESSNGNGSHGNGRHGTGVLSISRSDMKRDIRTYEAVKAQAEKQGIPISDIQVTD